MRRTRSSKFTKLESTYNVYYENIGLCRKQIWRPGGSLRLENHRVSAYNSMCLRAPRVKYISFKHIKFSTRLTHATAPHFRRVDRVEYFAHVQSEKKNGGEGRKLRNNHYWLSKIVLWYSSYNNNNTIIETNLNIKKLKLEIMFNTTSQVFYLVSSVTRLTRVSSLEYLVLQV